MAQKLKNDCMCAYEQFRDKNNHEGKYTKKDVGYETIKFIVSCGSLSDDAVTLAVG